jgi:hypothetical protein
MVENNRHSGHPPKDAATAVISTRATRRALIQITTLVYSSKLEFEQNTTKNCFSKCFDHFQNGMYKRISALPRIGFLKQRMLITTAQTCLTMHVMKMQKWSIVGEVLYFQHGMIQFQRIIRVKFVHTVVEELQRAVKCTCKKICITVVNVHIAFFTVLNM